MSDIHIHAHLRTYLRPTYLSVLTSTEERLYLRILFVDMFFSYLFIMNICLVILYNNLFIYYIYLFIAFIIL